MMLFLLSRTGVWALFPKVLNLIFALFNFTNGHRLAKYKSTAKHKTYTVLVLCTDGLEVKNKDCEGDGGDRSVQNNTNTHPHRDT